MICILKAVYQRLCGKPLLMIDEERDMGAWLQYADKTRQG
jgi:hypothetical protein